MSHLVVDSCVAVKWFVIESGEDHAEHLLTQFQARRWEFFVPELFWAEVFNTLRKHLLQGRIGLREFDDAAAVLGESHIQSLSCRELLQPALSCSKTLSISVYDAFFVALAKELDCPLVTADQKLYRACRGKTPVHLLGDPSL